ncbi:MAG: DinB family protein [Anaerolineales bacterium]|nr:DinB family protein [Anaerolineales bacterium]
MTTATQLFAHWQQVRRVLIETANKFTEADLSFAPFEGAWTVGQILCHIADAEEGWFQYVIHRQYEKWPDQFTPANYLTLAAIQQGWAEVHTRTEAYLDTLPLEDLDQIILTPWGSNFSLNWIIWHVIEHEIHHRGELSLILGMLGREGLDV